MKIKVYDPPKEADNSLYLSLRQYDGYVELQVVNANGGWQADLLRINENGVFRVGEVGETDVSGLLLDSAGRLAMLKEDPADG